MPFFPFFARSCEGKRRRNVICNCEPEFFLVFSEIDKISLATFLNWAREGVSGVCMCVRVCFCHVSVSVSLPISPVRCMWEGIVAIWDSDI
ncbi:hypothetical protein VTH06DRAFT_3853 [Thermothelomyces fergusii]